MMVEQLPPNSSIRIDYRPATVEIIDCLLEGDGKLAEKMNISVPDPWTEFGHAPFLYTKERLIAYPDELGWWSWLPVLRTENKLIGNCGYKGPPVNGMVEIGYEVAVEYRGKGYATEFAGWLIQRALAHREVQRIIAHTLPEENASTRILKKHGFQFAGDVEDPEDGKIWKWELIPVQ